MTIASAIPESLAAPTPSPSSSGPLSSAGSLGPAASRSGASAGGPAPSRPVRRLVALACALVLSAGLGACSITLDRAGGGSGSSGGAAEAPSDSGASSGAPTSAASASQTPTTRRIDDSPSVPVPSTTPSPSGSPTALPPLPSADPSRPGAGVTITNDDWVTAQQDKNMTMTPSNGQVVVDRSFKNIVIEGDVTDLTVNSDHVDVVVDYAQNVIVNGTGVHVYVRDTGSVTVTGRFNTVLWAGNTPQIQDLGDYNTIKNQAEED